ncbi:MAG: hypothetical protein PVJ09_02750 [Candidatus Woesebacteria bacterium]|jgi:hypothetical protein
MPEREKFLLNGISVALVKRYEDELHFCELCTHKNGRLKTAYFTGEAVVVLEGVKTLVDKSIVTGTLFHEPSVSNVIFFLADLKHWGKWPNEQH